MNKVIVGLVLSIGLIGSRAHANSGAARVAAAATVRHAENEIARARDNVQHAQLTYTSSLKTRSLEVVRAASAHLTAANATHRSILAHYGEDQTLAAALRTLDGVTTSDKDDARRFVTHVNQTATGDLL